MTDRKSGRQKKRPLRVGFDLDGVILYNPARVFRPAIYILKKVFLKKRLGFFYYPRSKIEKSLWWLFHKSSIFIASGFDEIIKLARKGKIQAYIITGRYSFLKKDLDQWLEKMNINSHFKGVFYNKKDEQPHVFKEKIIKKLKLDIFVEDNFDITNYLAKKTPAKVLWIYNIFDKKISYPDKFSTLKQVVSWLKKSFKR